MHKITHLSEKYENMRNSENGWSKQEAGMAQLDDDVGLVMKKLKDMGVDDNTIVLFTTDNGAMNFTWPDGGNTPFAGGKGSALEGGASEFLPSCVGLARFRPAKLKMDCSPDWTGFQPSQRPQEIRTSQKSS